MALRTRFTRRTRERARNPVAAKNLSEKGATVTVREHLTKAHLRSGEHFAKGATYHKTMAGHFRKLAGLAKNMQDDDQDDPLQIYGDISDAEGQQGDECTDMAEFHKNCAKSLMETGKAAGMSDSDIMPDMVSGLASPAIRGIPRHGQPPLDDRTTVDPAFEKLVSTD